MIFGFVQKQYSCLYKFLSISFAPVLAATTLSVWLICSSCGSTNQQAGGVIIFRDVHVISMENNQLLENQSVVVNNGRIEKIGPSSVIKIKDDQQFVDGSGKYLMPALSDIHIHLPKNRNLGQLRNTLKLLLAHGITLGRNMAGAPYQRAMLDQLSQENIPYPDLIMGSPFFRGGEFNSTDELIDSARSYASQNFDFLKVHSHLTQAEFDTLASIAAAVNLQLEGHIPKSKGLVLALTHGNYSIIDHLDGFFQELSTSEIDLSVEEHGYYGELLASQLDLSKMPNLITKIKEKDLALVPTQNLVRLWYEDLSDSLLGNYDNIEYIHPSYVVRWNSILITARKRLQGNQALASLILENRDSILRSLFYAGIPILCGSGSYEVNIIPGFSLLEEMLVLEKVGFTPYEVLQTTTSAVGNWYNMERGKIKEGWVADFILLNENPLENLSALKDLAGLFTKNAWLNETTLKGYLAEVADDLNASKKHN